MPNLKFAVRVRLIFWLLSLALNFLSGEAFAVPLDEKPSHCAAEEYSYFSCRLVTSDTVISLCGTTVTLPTGDMDVLLDYRSGPMGAVTYKFPENPISANSGKFTKVYSNPYGGGMVYESISFRDKDVAHELVDIYGRSRFVGVDVFGSSYREHDCDVETVTSSMEGLIIEYLPDAPRIKKVTVEPVEKKPTQCFGNEVTFFSCGLKESTTVVSLCGTKVSRTDGTEDVLVEFKSGALGEVDFIFPESPASALDRQVFSEYDRAVSNIEFVEVVDFRGKGGFRIKTSTDGNLKFIEFITPNEKKHNQYQCAVGTVTNEMKGFISRYFPFFGFSL